MNRKFKNFFKKTFKIIGPGFITGAADDDPSGIATYSQTGVKFGFTQLWIALYSLPFMIAVQEMCGRIGMVTGKGLAGVIKTKYSKSILYVSVVILLVANIINIGADLGAMAESFQLFFNIPTYIILIFITLFTLFLEVVVSYPRYAKFLKFLTLSFLSYIITAFIVRENWHSVFQSLILPHIELSKDYLMNIAALLGTTISPYLFFWQADEEVEDEITHKKIRALGVGKPKINAKDIKQMGWDTTAGMFFSNLITFFIIMTVASTLGSAGLTNISTAAQAAKALRPLAGDLAGLLFAVGIIGMGLLTVPILAGSAAYAVAEAANLKAGLSKNFYRAKGFYLIIILATVVGVFTTMLPIGPIQMLYYAAILNGLLAPPLLLIILMIANNKEILGKRTNSKLSNIFGISITVVMSAIAIALIVSLFH